MINLLTDLIDYSAKTSPTLHQIPAVQYNDWLEEECDNMAREGLRTLVVAKKTLSQEQYEDFERRYTEAKLSIHDRARQVKWR